MCFSFFMVIICKKVSTYPSHMNNEPVLGCPSLTTCGPNLGAAITASEDNYDLVPQHEPIVAANLIGDGVMPFSIDLGANGAIQPSQLPEHWQDKLGYQIAPVDSGN